MMGMSLTCIPYLTCGSFARLKAACVNQWVRTTNLTDRFNMFSWPIWSDLWHKPCSMLSYSLWAERYKPQWDPAVHVPLQVYCSDLLAWYPELKNTKLDVLLCIFLFLDWTAGEFCSVASVFMCQQYDVLMGILKAFLTQHWLQIRWSMAACCFINKRKTKRV